MLACAVVRRSVLAVRLSPWTDPVSVRGSRLPRHGDPSMQSGDLKACHAAMHVRCTCRNGAHLCHSMPRRSRRPPKPSRLLEDAFDGTSGAGESPRAFLAHRHGARSSGRSAPRPIPGTGRLFSAASVALPLRPPSQRQLARMQSMPAGSCQRRTDAASDDEQTAFHEGVDDESGMLSAGSGLEGIDSPEALIPLCMTDDESDSEGDGGFGGDEKSSDAVSSQATSLLYRRSFDVGSVLQCVSDADHSLRNNLPRQQRLCSSWP